MKRQKPIRLAKKEEKKPLIDENNMIAGVPLSFILITIIFGSAFLLILLLMGPCTESGLWFNFAHA